MGIVKKPLPAEIRERLKPDTKTVWIKCPKCGCEWQCTEKSRQANLKWYEQPDYCYDCYLIHRFQVLE